MRRVLALPAALLTAVALAACSAGVLDQDPPAASGPSASPSAEPSATPEPTPEGERFDDVDLAAALVPLPFEPGEPESWGPWSTQARAEIIPSLASSVFADAPECSAAVEQVVANAPEEVVVGGYPFDGDLVTSIIVARMASAETASGYLDALEAATTTCDEVEGVPAIEFGMYVLQPLLEPSTVLDEAGFVSAQLGYDQSYHPSTYVVGAVDELLVLSTSSAGVEGWDTETVGLMQTEIDALEAAAPTS